MKEELLMQTEQMAIMYENGKSYAKIGEIFGLNRVSVWERLKRFGVKSRSTKPDPKQTEEMAYWYNEGYSFGKIGKMYNMSGNGIKERLVKFGIKLRPKKVIPFIVYDNKKWTITSGGYYRNTNSHEGSIMLHRYKYEKEVGEIPEGFDIHHIDFNKINNDIDNLQCLLKADHTRLHHELKDTLK